MADTTVLSDINELLERRLTDGIAVCCGNKDISKQFFRGHISDDPDRSISGNTLYDLASVTKCLTTITVLKLQEEGRLSLDAAVGDYSSDYPRIAHLKLYELLNFSKALRTDGRVDAAKTPDEALECLKTAYVASEAPAYNDIGPNVLSRIVDEILEDERGFEHYSEKIWGNLSMDHTYWWYKVPTTELINTQCYDYEYRIVNSGLTVKRTPKGRCHDGAAAALRKAAGHAGFFSTPDDMVILSKSLLTGKLLTPESIGLWASDKYACRSEKAQYYGLGCYRKNPKREDSEVPAACSERSIAISGYSGTYVLWDFENQAYCFIGSNRIYKRLTRSDGSCSFEEITSVCKNDIICDASQYVYYKDKLVDDCVAD